MGFSRIKVCAVVLPVQSKISTTPALHNALVLTNLGRFALVRQLGHFSLNRSVVSAASCFVHYCDYYYCCCFFFLLRDG